MKTAINNNYHMKSLQKNDIFRKFQKPFRYLLNDSLPYDENTYVEQSSTRYTEEFDAFTTSYSNDVRYFIGYTGCGKSTFIRHYFGLNNSSPKIMDDGTTLVIPSFWNSKTINKKDYNNIIHHIEGSINSAIREIDSEISISFPLNDFEELFHYIQKTRGDILATLSPEEITQINGDKKGIILRMLTNAQKKTPLEYNSSCLKYFIERHSNITRVIFIIDDVETLDIDSLNILVDSYYHIYDCFKNIEHKQIIVNLLISLRPHSFRYLRDHSISHEKIIAYGNHLESRCYHIIRNDIPNIREIFIKRFNSYADKIEPGNQETWEIAKQNLFSLVNEIEESYIGIITDLCHMNIRAIFDCLQLILSNRIWCQESKIPTVYPSVNIRDYNFNNIVNLLRTLSCGESSVYTGIKNLQFNASDLDEMQPRPKFDGSDVFIPNIINNLYTRECDLTTIYIMYYLENKFSSTNNTPVNTEFIKVGDLINNIKGVLNRNEGDFNKYLMETIKYLFRNRIIRKSIYDRDAPISIDVIDENTYIYFTKKGSRLLKLFREDSILLEIYREDIVRAYSDESHCKSSFELVTEQKRDLLFEDLIDLSREIFYVEDRLITKSLEVEDAYFPNDFFGSFRLTEDICQGLLRTFSAAKSINTREFSEKIENLKTEIGIRKSELSKINH